MSSIRSQVAAFPVNRTTATIVMPPFVAIFKVRDPASRYCDLVLSKLTCPLPFGPPRALYVGTFPTAAFVRVDIDANEGLVVRAMNLAQAVAECDDMTFTVHVPSNLHPCTTSVVHCVFFCGLLFSPQQSCTVVVSRMDLNPAGHA